MELRFQGGVECLGLSHPGVLGKEWAGLEGFVKELIAWVLMWLRRAIEVVQRAWHSICRQDPGIAHGGIDVQMSQGLLELANVHARLQGMYGEAMPKGECSYRNADTGSLRDMPVFAWLRRGTLHDILRHADTQMCSIPPADENIVTGFASTDSLAEQGE